MLPPSYSKWRRGSCWCWWWGCTWWWWWQIFLIELWVLSSCTMCLYWLCSLIECMTYIYIYIYMYVCIKFSWYNIWLCFFLCYNVASILFRVKMMLMPMLMMGMHLWRHLMICPAAPYVLNWMLHILGPILCTLRNGDMFCVPYACDLPKTSEICVHVYI